jgi:hypothetical protein
MEDNPAFIGAINELCPMLKNRQTDFNRQLFNKNINQTQ